MAILHNLSDPSNVLTCFDPVAGINDGTTVGRSYVLRKIFDAMLAFDTDLKEVTNAAPTPDFLQAEAGNLLSNATVGQDSVNDLVRFYRASDPGLTQTPPAAMIIEWRVSNNGNTNYNLFNVRVYHKISPSTICAPLTATYDILCNNAFSSTLGQMAYQKQNYVTTTTTMQNICRVFLYKSSNMKGFFAVSKFDASFRGGYIWFDPPMTGYLKTGDNLVEGLNYRYSAFLNGAFGTIAIQGIYPTYWDINTGGLIDGLTPLSSCGWPPEGLFTVAGNQRIIGAKMKLAHRNVNYMTISDEIEGILLANPTLVNGNVGTVILMNGNYYYLFYQISDGRRAYRVLLPLTTN